MDKLSANPDLTIQAIFDDVIYSSLRFDIVGKKKGYRLLKENGVTQSM